MVADWLGSGHFNHLGSEAAQGRFLFLSLSNSAFEINKKTDWFKSRGIRGHPQTMAGKSMNTSDHADLMYHGDLPLQLMSEVF